MRARAIACALFYGIVPSRFYEETPHHDASYLAHLWMNVLLAARWATWRETVRDREFELNTNAKASSVHASCMQSAGVAPCRCGHSEHEGTCAQWVDSPWTLEARPCGCARYVPNTQRSTPMCEIDRRAP